MEWNTDRNQEKFYSQKSLDLNICLFNKKKKVQELIHTKEWSSLRLVEEKQT